MKLNNVLKVSFLSFLFSTQISSSFPWEYATFNNLGVKRYLEQNYSEAESYFQSAQREEPNNIEIKYNYAGNLYKQGKYIESQTIFLDLLKEKNIKEDLKQKINYNLGNLLYKMGVKDNPEIFWSTALGYYQKAMELNPKDLEAKENYEFVLKKLSKISNNSNNKNNNRNTSNKQSNEKQSANNSQTSNNTSNTPPSSSPNNSQKNNTNFNYYVNNSETNTLLEEAKRDEANFRSYLNRKLASDAKAKNILMKDW